jgi:hypothetical protein
MPAPLKRLVTAAIVTGVSIAAAGCAGSSTPQPTATHQASAPPATFSAPPIQASGQRPAEQPPAGYRWAGSSAQGIWVAIPKTWVALNLAKLSLSQVTKRFATTGIGTTAMQADLANLKKQDALFFADLASYVTSAHGFTTNASALCTPATAIEPGAAGIAGLQAAMRAEYAKLKARVLSVAPVSVAGGQAFAAKLALTSTAGFDITELQVVILSSTGHSCFVTFSTDDAAAFLHTFGKAAATIHVG